MKKSDKELLEALKNNPDLLKQVQEKAEIASKKKDQKRYDSNKKVLKDGEVQLKGRNLYAYRWTDEKGKRREVYASDLDSLRRKERQIQKDIEEGIKTNEANFVTIGMVWEQFFDMKKSAVKGKTLINYVGAYDRYIVKIKDEKIRSFRYSDIVNFYRETIEENQIGQATLEIVHLVLSGMFELCIKNQYITVNPCKDALKAVKEMCRRKQKREALTYEEQTSILNFITESSIYQRWLPMITVALCTGMRMSEICGLTWDNVDFDSNEIHVEHQLEYYKAINEEKMCWHLQDTKTKAGKRTIPMLTETRLALLQEKAYQQDYGLTSPAITGLVNHEKKTVSGFCFLNANSTPYTVNGVDCSLRRIKNAYNEQEKIVAKEEGRKPVLIKSFSSHILRHTFSTRLAEADTNIKVQQAIMGHENIQTTMNIYTDAQPKKIHEEFKKIDKKMKWS